MLCRIADLLVEIPAAGGMTLRCEEYLTAETENADIIIYADRYKYNRYPNLDLNGVAYLESGWQFYQQLLKYDGIYLHSSAVEMNGRAYLFSGPCGTGKSTHTKIWQQTFGSAAQVFNDDKPALRRLNGKWYAYGTPWCGKDGINQNKKIPLAGICFLRQASENKIRQLAPVEGFQRIISQTKWKFNFSQNLDLMLKNSEKLALEIPVFELENRPEPEAALLSYETMRRKAEEIGL
jgi:hypothetical protein